MLFVSASALRQFSAKIAQIADGFFELIALPFEIFDLGDNARRGEYGIEMARLGISILRQEKILYFSERKSELPPLKDQRKALAIRHAIKPCAPAAHRL